LKTLPSAVVNQPVPPADDHASHQATAGLPDGPNHLSPDDYLAAVLADADRIAAACDVGPPSSTVAACPGWSLVDLVTHVGAVHRWATEAITTGDKPAGRLDATPGDGDPATWLREGAGALVDALDAVDPAAPAWHIFPGPKQQWFWFRRMAVETMLHRVDAEVAIGSTSTLRTDLAIVGLHEVFTSGYPRTTARETLAYPSSTLHIHCTDDDRQPGWGEWLMRYDGGEGGEGYVVTTEHAKGDAAIRSDAGPLLLALMHRSDHSTLDIVGDADAAEAWLALPAW